MFPPNKNDVIEYYGNLNRAYMFTILYLLSNLLFFSWNMFMHQKSFFNMTWIDKQACVLRVASIMGQFAEWFDMCLFKSISSYANFGSNFGTITHPICFVQCRCGFKTSQLNLKAVLWALGRKTMWKKYLFLVGWAEIYWLCCICLRQWILVGFQLAALLFFFFKSIKFIYLHPENYSPNKTRHL